MTPKTSASPFYAKISAKKVIPSEKNLTLLNFELNLVDSNEVMASVTQEKTFTVDLC